MKQLPTLSSMPTLKGKRVLVRVDLNVPMAHGKVLDKTRITRLKSTLEYLYKKDARVIVLSHFGRPKNGYDLSLSLAPIADALSESLDGKPVKFAVDCVGKSVTDAVNAMQDGEVLLLENVRFHADEEKNDKTFADQLAALGDVYVNDTFSCSHRAHASITGLAERLPAYAGILLHEEVTQLETYLSNPVKPMAAIVGGDEERATIRNETTMQRDAIHDGRHTVFANAIIDICATIVGRGNCLHGFGFSKV